MRRVFGESAYLSPMPLPGRSHAILGRSLIPHSLRHNNAAPFQTGLSPCSSLSTNLLAVLLRPNPNATSPSCQRSSAALLLPSQAGRLPRLGRLLHRRSEGSHKHWLQDLRSSSRWSRIHFMGGGKSRMIKKQVIAQPTAQSPCRASDVQVTGAVDSCPCCPSTNLAHALDSFSRMALQPTSSPS